MFGPLVGYGYLPRYTGPHPNLLGCMIGREVPTRWEEYAFVLDTLQEMPRGGVLDAGCGFDPQHHLLPLILGNLGCGVTGMDADSRVVQMTPHSRVQWVRGDIRDTGLPDASVDYYCCVSVLEHLSGADLYATLTEATRILKPGGLLCATADWLPAHFLAHAIERCGLNPGSEVPMSGEHLDPMVTWVRAQKATG